MPKTTHTVWGAVWFVVMFDARKIIAAGSMFAAVLVLLWPPEFLTPEMYRAAALCIFSLGLFAGGVFPEHVSAVLFFLIAMLFSVAPADIIFSGFHSTALWLVFGGITISVAVKETGLGPRLAELVGARLQSSYLAIVAGVAGIGLLSTFLIPTGMGRVIVLVPVIMSLADRFGFVEGTRGRTGILITFCFCAIFPGFTILPANVPNVILMGGIESQYGIYLSYGEYALLHFPVLGFLKALLIVGLAWMSYGEPPKDGIGAGLKKVNCANEERSFSQSELRLAAVLFTALLLWVFDFVHHISPGWIALGAALLCLMPNGGILTASDFSTKLDFTPIFTSAGILGIASLVAHSGIGELLGHSMLEAAHLSSDNQGQTLIALVLTAMGVGLAGTILSIPAVMTPLAGGVSEASGMPLELVLMTQAVAYSTVLLPYQLPPLLIASQVSGLGLAVTSRFCLLLAICTVLVLLPLDYLWWSFLGYLK